MRHNFSNRKKVQSLPNLIDVQLNSYNWLRNEGINEILEEIGTIEDYTGRGWVLTFSNPQFDKENLSLQDALYKGRTYDAPWYVTATLSDPLNKKEKSQAIYMGDLPMMTEAGTFVVNGVERVVINQLRRAEGVLFTNELHPTTGRNLGGAKVLPKNGAWLEFETSRSGVISVKIDRRRKMSATVLLRIFGLDRDEDIRRAFQDIDTDAEISFIDNTLAKDPSASYNEAVLEIYKKMRPGEPLVLENARGLVNTYFFNKRRYNLGKVGRFKLNKVLGSNYPEDTQLLQLEDLVQIISHIIEINKGTAKESDVDHLANRRVRSVGELLQDEMRIGFLRMERNIRERMGLLPREELPEPSALISARTVAAAIHGFFATGQLSQHHDQQNPVTAVDHLRRLSVTGPGGLTRERASMSVRDVHYSSFGKICPVRTPEGPNVGLINYLASYAHVNPYGFLETPYVKLEKDSAGSTVITDEVVYLTALDEEETFITDSSVERNEKGVITQTQVPVRKGNNFTLGNVSNAQYVELTPGQTVGLIAGLIPFLANDDISRALMGTQQMSQAVPLVKPEAPIVATGLETDIAENAGILVRAEAAGEVTYADASTVKVRYAGDKKDTEYTARKFVKSNAKSSVNQKVLVELGQKVKKSDLLIEGPASDKGEIALGANVKVAYMIYEGYEFEDGIIISDRLIKDDVLTSIHITNYRVYVLETKLGPEEITADIPNVSEESLRNLDDEGIVVVGAQVKSGDILVGKVEPKGEVDLSAEERLLRAIFGEKAKEVRDNSLVMPHGTHGSVIDVKRVTRKDNNNLPNGVIEEITVYVAEQKKIQVGDKLAGRHGNKGVISAVIPEVDMPHLEDGTPIDVIFSSEAVLKRMNVGQLLEAPLAMAGRKLGKSYIVANFEPLPEAEINAELQKANIPLSGKMPLIDGRTGQYFHAEIVVGETNLLKLLHMSEAKMNARSTGPYSLITQQPLGGKSQMGGQRLGEMEVWALQSYGAAHILREMLTIKSDDWLGRTQAYKAILQNQPIPESNTPESFKLLVRELNGLLLGINPLGAVTEKETIEDLAGVLQGDSVADKKSAKESFNELFADSEGIGFSELSEDQDGAKELQEEVIEEDK